MKRSLELLTPRQPVTIPLRGRFANDWVQFIGMVFAFIVVWQVLSRGLVLLDRWF